MMSSFHIFKDTFHYKDHKITSKDLTLDYPLARYTFENEYSKIECDVLLLKIDTRVQIIIMNSLFFDDKQYVNDKCLYAMQQGTIYKMDIVNGDLIVYVSFNGLLLKMMCKKEQKHLLNGLSENIELVFLINKL